MASDKFPARDGEANGRPVMPMVTRPARAAIARVGDVPAGVSSATLARRYGYVRGPARDTSGGETVAE
jgi:hypothetical protein